MLYEFTFFVDLRQSAATSRAAARRTTTVTTMTVVMVWSCSVLVDDSYMLTCGVVTWYFCWAILKSLFSVLAGEILAERLTVSSALIKSYVATCNNLLAMFSCCDNSFNTFNLKFLSLFLSCSSYVKITLTWSLKTFYSLRHTSNHYCIFLKSFRSSLLSLDNSLFLVIVTL